MLILHLPRRANRELEIANLHCLETASALRRSAWSCWRGWLLGSKRERGVNSMLDRIHRLNGLVNGSEN